MKHSQGDILGSIKPRYKLLHHVHQQKLWLLVLGEADVDEIVKETGRA